jgi:5,10-methylenetetrahydrofolate reductase
MSRQLFSFEFFPPQTPEGVVKLAAVRSQLAPTDSRVEPTQDRCGAAL